MIHNKIIQSTVIYSYGTNISQSFAQYQYKPEWQIVTIENISTFNLVVSSLMSHYRCYFHGNFI